MGEAKKGALKIRFDRRLRLEFHGTRITSDAGLLACRELDDALGLTVRAPVQLQEIRHGRNIQHELAPLLRQSVYSRLAGYEDTNDAERLAQDPAMQAVVGRRALEKQAAGANTLSRFETEVLTREENLKGLSELNREWVDRAMALTPSANHPGHGQLGKPRPWGAAPGPVDSPQERPPLELEPIRLGGRRALRAWIAEGLKVRSDHRPRLSVRCTFTGDRPWDARPASCGRPTWLL